MQISGNWFYYNGGFRNEESLKNIISEKKNTVYEILRVINSRPLFLENHYTRFKHSLEKLNIKTNIQLSDIQSILRDVLLKNNYSLCNIRFEMTIESGKHEMAAFIVPFNYPEDEVYTKGVKVLSIQIERENPNIKQSVVSNSVCSQIKSMIEKDDIFEVFLVDHLECITEGSRSNVFFIRDNEIYSPPSSKILKGITRKKVIEIAEKKKIAIHQQAIPYSDIKQFDACFITGTSPKIMPIKQIDDVSFTIPNSLVTLLINEYDLLIRNYCT